MLLLFYFCFVWGVGVFTVDLFAMLETDPGTLRNHIQKANLTQALLGRLTSILETLNP